MGEDPKKYFLQPGYIFTSNESYMIHTVLGSCVSICLFDSIKKQGGMNHFIYSAPKSKEQANARYGSISIPYLIKLIKDMGSEIKDVKAHLVGGASNPNGDSYKIGKHNVEIAKKVLKKYRIEIVTEETGGTLGRKVVFDNISGEILVYKVNNIRSNDWYEARD